jgi:glucosamine-6-phosphate deaminase
MKILIDLNYGACKFPNIMINGINMTHTIIPAQNADDFGIKARDAFYASIMGIDDLPWVILPTGNTPKPFYDALRADDKRNYFHYLQLDEYQGLQPDDSILFSNWLARDVLDPLEIRHRMTFNTAADPAQEIARIRAWYNQHQRIDVAVLGIGEDGHVGFNLPNNHDCLTHQATLNDMTWEANNKYWGREVPRKVTTLGVSELRLAKTTILLARGENKAEALRKAFHEPSTPLIPASYLQYQDDVIIVADEAALSRMPK